MSATKHPDLFLVHHHRWLDNIVVELFPNILSQAPNQTLGSVLALGILPRGHDQIVLLIPQV